MSSTLPPSRLLWILVDHPMSYLKLPISMKYLGIAIKLLTQWKITCPREKSWHYRASALLAAMSHFRRSSFFSLFNEGTTPSTQHTTNTMRSTWVTPGTHGHWTKHGKGPTQQLMHRRISHLSRMCRPLSGTSQMPQISTTFSGDAKTAPLSFDDPLLLAIRCDQESVLGNLPGISR